MSPVRGSNGMAGELCECDHGGWWHPDRGACTIPRCQCTEHRPVVFTRRPQLEHEHARVSRPSVGATAE